MAFNQRMPHSTESSTSPGAAAPLVLVTLGDPGGIGPEVIAKALADEDVRRRARWLVLGPAGVLLSAAERAGLSVRWQVDEVLPVRPGEVGIHSAPYASGEFPPVPNAAAGELSFKLVDDAIGMMRSGLADARGARAVVTGPISKEAWRLAGHGEFPGHTELFAERFGIRRFGMMFVSPRLRVILVTAHVPLAAVPGALSSARIEQVIDLGAQACRDMGIRMPRVAVCGLNPHAGEAGLLGSEDAEVIAPAIEASRKRGIDARGPFPGDTIFGAAVNGAFDLVVAMYHDQGLIPVKLLDRDRAVNMTVGLPVVRTSPDHGTAFDIAGQNKAHPGSMKAAMRLAAEVAAIGVRG